MSRTRGVQVSIVIPFVRVTQAPRGRATQMNAGAAAATGDVPVRQVEDIAICARLRALGAPTFLPLAVVTSSRKFERMGIRTSFARVVLILLCLRLGRNPPQALFAEIR